jgi:hypothetical protein
MNLEQFHYSWGRLGFHGSPDELAGELAAIKPEDIVKAACGDAP